MDHIDEHLLELYVLNAPEIQSRKGDIQDHLKECCGCKELINRMIEFHSELEFESRIEPHNSASSDTALIRARHSLEPYPGFSIPPTVYTRGNIPGKFSYFVRHHPVMMTLGTFSFALLLVFLLNFSLGKFNGRSTITDRNPMHSMYNVGANTVEILNKDDQLLWDAKIINAQEVAASEIIHNTYQTIISDLEGKGTNNVLTTVSLIDFPDRYGQHLRIFDGNRNLLKDIRPVETVKYRGRTDEYSPYFSLSIFLLNGPANGKKEIFTIGSSIGRSPSVIFRLDNGGTTIGEYWHFGQFNSMCFRNIGNEGDKRLIVVGTNDTKDVTHEEYPIIAVLAPDKILGQKKASACPDFLLEPADAELYYIRIPASDLDTLLHTHGTAILVADKDEQTLDIMVESGAEIGTRYNFNYYFDHTMKLLRVKSNNTTDAYHQRLADTHKLNGLIDRTYLDNLRNNIRYWNGTSWQKEVVRVQHLASSTTG